MKTSDYAWAAGFFDGEGCTHLNNRRPQLSLFQVEREPLERLVSSLGGKVRGPYGPYAKSRPNTKPIYCWVAYGHASVDAMRLMWPYLCSIKKKQYIEVFRRGLSI